ncbi:MAG: vitamin K epoxide reductase family protein [Anaerolineae bacterium]|jgi:uncharacterized membrane protein/thiol-disulfide isomerase/thioredoxin|nr:vitamin K epoxide reductase family protein [Anaerolineae bacterium]
MRKILRGLLPGWSLLCLFLGQGAVPVRGQESVVHAIMFYSPNCGHCHQVITEVLPPLLEQYDEQFAIVGVNTATPEGQGLYQATIETFDIPEERRGVPTLVLGETVLVGSGEIPEQLPGLIASGLATGGVGWPAIPGLEEALAATSPTPTAGAASGETPAETPIPSPEAVLPDLDSEAEDWRARFARDPLGNTFSVVILLGMVGVVLYRLVVGGRSVGLIPVGARMVVPVLVVLGLIVAGYLAYVETQQVTAVCGPVGDCNSVQQSEFALLFGVLPIAVLGVMGYIGIGAAWLVARYAKGVWVNLASLTLVGMAWFGILFSIYLTFLEPFVIGATCAWCLTSAVLMTVLFWIITTAPQIAPAELLAQIKQLGMQRNRIG